MSDQICDALGLPRMEDVLKEAGIESHEDDLPDDPEVADIAVALGDATAVHAVVQQVQDEEGTIEHSTEMNEIYEEAMAAHRDLMDLAMNMEAKNAGSVAEPAATFLKIALDASKNKNDSKMRKLRLRLDREKFEANKIQKSNEVIDVTEESFMANRNELLKIISQRRNEK
jgi:hypothetical protein